MEHFTSSVCLIFFSCCCFLVVNNFLWLGWPFLLCWSVRYWVIFIFVSTLIILLRNIPSPHLSAKSSFNYEILSDVFLQCVFKRVLDYSKFSLFSFPKHSEGQLLSFFDSDNYNVI